MKHKLSSNLDQWYQEPLCRAGARHRGSFSRKEYGMQLIGQPVKHSKFGKGIVTDWKDTIITVCFDIGEKKFIYPEAFANFLILQNDVIQKQIQTILDAREAKKEEDRRALQEMQERRSVLNNLKISLPSQAVLDIALDQIDEVFSFWPVSSGLYISGYSRGATPPWSLKAELYVFANSAGQAADGGKAESDWRIYGRRRFCWKPLSGWDYPSSPALPTTTSTSAAASILAVYRQRAAKAAVERKCL